MICLNQRDKVCARFENSTWALRKDGRLKVGPVVSEVLMDEVVVTALAMLEARRRSKNRFAASAGANAGASASLMAGASA